MILSLKKLEIKFLLPPVLIYFILLLSHTRDLNFRRIALNVKSLLYTNKSTSRFYLDSATVQQVLIEPL